VASDPFCLGRRWRLLGRAAAALWPSARFGQRGAVASGTICLGPRWRLRGRTADVLWPGVLLRQRDEVASACHRPRRRWRLLGREANALWPGALFRQRGTKACLFDGLLPGYRHLHEVADLLLLSAPSLHIQPTPLARQPTNECLLHHCASFLCRECRFAQTRPAKFGPGAGATSSRLCHP
jgi:hypothetical protein